MIKLKNILNEIGEGSAKPYKWKADHKTKMSFGIDVTDYEYVWETDSGLEYVMTIETTPVEGQGHWSAAFGPYKWSDAIYDLQGRKLREPGRSAEYETETNRGELFNIMATIVDVFKDFMKQAENSEWGLKAVEYEGSKAEDAKSNQRNKLYAAYIKKHLPNATIRNIHGDKMEIIFK
tara:strand:- start:2083 stop:2616 length:534 start_codon:yes stop_codon:yes gene_type:complete